MWFDLIMKWSRPTNHIIHKRWSLTLILSLSFIWNGLFRSVHGQPQIIEKYPLEWKPFNQNWSGFLLGNVRQTVANRGLEWWKLMAVVGLGSAHLSEHSIIKYLFFSSLRNQREHQSIWRANCRAVVAVCGRVGFDVWMGFWPSG